MNLDSHRVPALVENARFLMDRAELPKDAVARRLGVSESALEQMLERAKHAEQDPSGGEGRRSP